MHTTDAPRPTPDAPPAPRYPALDAIRGLAALAVVGFHAFKDIVEARPGEGGPLMTLALSLDWAVPVFFVLSGFLLYGPFAAAALTGGGGAPDARRFLWRRAIRILPAYWLAIVAYGTLAKPDMLWTPDGVLRYGLLLQTFDEATVYHVVAPTWTLAIEAWFYLSLPIVAVVLAWLARGDAGRPTLVRHLGALAAVTVAAALIARTVVTWLLGVVGQRSEMASFTLFGTFELFALGMGLAVIRVHRRELRGGLRRIGRRGRAIVGRDRTWLALAAAAWTLGLVLEARHITPWHSTLAGGLAGALLMVPAVFRPARSRLARVLGRTRPLVFLGAVSYGLYLWHWPIQELAMDAGWDVPSTWGGYTVAVLLVGAVALVPAWISYRLVERPIIDWGRRNGPGASRPKATPATGPRVRAGRRVRPASTFAG